MRALPAGWTARARQARGQEPQVRWMRGWSCVEQLRRENVAQVRQGVTVDLRDALLADTKPPADSTKRCPARVECRDNNAFARRQLCHLLGDGGPHRLLRDAQRWVDDVSLKLVAQRDDMIGRLRDRSVQ